jgi:hypothetical protein
MRQRRAAVRGAAVAALLTLAAVLGAGCGADVEPHAKTATQGARAAAPSPSTTTLDQQPSDGPSTRTRASKVRPPLAFVVHRRAQLRSGPSGKVVGTIRTKTEFKSPTILAVVGRRPGWVLVRTSLEKHHVGWLPAGAGQLFSQPRSIVIDLSRHRLSIFHRGRLTDT